jgi:PncC family amidohydrolase
VVVAEMNRRGLSLSVAESVTGGLINSFLTDVPGASAVLQGGVVAYSSAMKSKVLGVSQELIEKEGVVSAATASAMAQAVRRLCSTDIGLATTGEAGPQAATDAPVGTVFIGLAVGEETYTFERRYFGDREIIRRRSSLAAIDILRRHLLEQPQLQ